MAKTIRTLLVGIGIIVLVGIYCIIQTQKSKVVYIYFPDPNIPSAREIQQRLEDIGNPRYDPKGVDGIIGKDSIKAWDNYTCDQYAKRAIEGNRNEN